jgi:hypothetical protein
VAEEHEVVGTLINKWSKLSQSVVTIRYQSDDGGTNENQRHVRLTHMKAI